MDQAVEIFGITKKFSDFRAVDHLDLKINHEFFGPLGLMYGIGLNVPVLLVSTAVHVRMAAGLDQRVV